MATLTVALEPELVELAQKEAERRHLSVNQLMAELIEEHIPHQAHDASEILRLLSDGPLGEIDRPLTRGEIYATHDQ